MNQHTSRKISLMIGFVGVFFAIAYAQVASCAKCRAAADASTFQTQYDATMGDWVTYDDQLQNVQAEIDALYAEAEANDANVDPVALGMLQNLAEAIAETRDGLLPMLGRIADMTLIAADVGCDCADPTDSCCACCPHVDPMIVDGGTSNTGGDNTNTGGDTSNTGTDVGNTSGDNGSSTGDDGSSTGDDGSSTGDDGSSTGG